MSLAVITGCTKGIGASVTKVFLKNGCDICGCYSRDILAKDEFISEISKYNQRSYIFQSDLSTQEGVVQFVKDVKSVEQKVNYLILNAAITDRTPYKEIEYENWNKVMFVNLYAPLFITQGLDELLAKNGRIIFIGAVMGQFPHAMSLSYAVSKAGIHQMAKNLVKEYADRKITVNVVAPGFVETPWQKSKSPEHKQRIESKIALKRFAMPDEIAELCWSIAENPYVNGSIINIDGGYDYK